MITFIEGILEEKQPTRVVLNVSGVGYEVLIPLSSYDRLPAVGDRCRIQTHDYIREDAHLLFGFMTVAEREMFELMLGISGVGPKLAISALSGMSVREFTAAVVEGDVKRLSGIKGVGRKTAERMVIELRDRIGAADALEAVAGGELPDQRGRDAMLALISLGYKEAEAQKMVHAVLKSAATNASVEELIRAALAR